MATRLDIQNTSVPDMNNWDETAIDQKTTDGISDAKETEWTSTFWTKYWGYYNEHPELKSALNLKAIWNIGKGYTTDNATKATLSKIKGQGNESFDDVLYNMELIRRINGDSFAEIIRSASGALLNIKPLDPGSIRIIFDGKGIIKRYEQFNKLGSSKTNKQTVHIFKTTEIFHLSNNRLADQIHGISDIESLDKTILAEIESFSDITKVMHRQAKPFIIFKYKTDDLVKVEATAKKIDALREVGNDLHIPDDDNILSYEVVEVNVSQIIMEWRNDIRNKFYRSIGLPQIMPGAGGQGTESDSKVIYFAFERLVERDQRYIENQVKMQLHLDIDLIPPASMSQDLRTDSKKDAGINVAQPNDTEAGVGQ